MRDIPPFSPKSNQLLHRRDFFILSFHHQIATCIENVKFREVNVDVVPGSKIFHLLPETVKVVPQKMAAAKITHRRAHTHEIRMF